MTIPRSSVFSRFLATFACLAFLLAFGARSAALAVPGSGAGLGLLVTPLRLDVNNEQRNASITIENTNDSPVTLRVDLRAWDQTTGTDHYAPSGDMVIVPPILNIAAGQQKVVRLGLRAPVSGTGEQSFRVFITQVPLAIHGAGIVQLAYRVALPVFVHNGAPLPPVPNATAQLSGPKRITIAVSNAGKTHFRINMIHIYSDPSRTRSIGDHQISVGYVLPGATRSIVFDFKQDLQFPTLVLEGTDGSDHPFSIPVLVSKS